MPRVLGYTLRHGSTAISPKSEGWLQIPLDTLGRADAADGAEFIAHYDGPKPDWGVASDLARATETLAIAAQILGIKTLKPMSQFRAFEKTQETDRQFEKRTLQGFASVMETASKTKTTPLICWHRSNNVAIAKFVGKLQSPVHYEYNSIVHEGGVTKFGKDYIQPIFKFIGENSLPDVVQPFDGTQISGFVTAKDNPPPRECGSCRWYDEDHCDHPIVTADEGLGLMYGKHRNPKGKWVVKADECCDNFQSVKSIRSV